MDSAGGKFASDAEIESYARRIVAEVLGLPEEENPSEEGHG